MIERRMLSSSIGTVGNPEEARTEMVTASEAPTIAGISPYDTPLQLWCRKRGYLPYREGTEAMAWGNRLQGAILAELDAVPNDKLWVMPNEDIGATPDGFTTHSFRRCIVEVKTTRWHVGRILAYASVQVQAQMLVTNNEHALIGVLIGGQELRTYEVERNDRFIGWLLARMRLFLQQLRENVPPEPRATDQKAIEALFPEPCEPGVVMLPDEACAMDAEIQRLKARVKDDGEQIDEMKNKLRLLIGEHRDGILRTGGRYRWGMTNRKEFTVAAKSYRTLTRAKR